MIRLQSVAVGCTLGLLIAGCGSPTDGIADNDGPRLQVQYEGHPIADVHVRLHASENGDAVLQGITDRNGQIRFADVPLSEPNEYFVSMESVGDGDWILDTKRLEKSQTPMRLQPFGTTPEQHLTLPPKSIRSLTRNTR